MTDDQERDEKLPPNEFVPGEDDFDEEPEEGQEAADEAAFGSEDEDEAGAAAVGAGADAAAGASRSRFGRRATRETEEHRTVGSVRGTHERVHIDDRPSAIFAIICAVGLLGLLAFTWVGSSGIIPQPSTPTLAPFVIATGNITLTPATPTPVATATVIATASPTSAPTASPSPSVNPSPTK